MARRERRKFTDEYRAEVVALVRSSGKSIGEISRALDLTENGSPRLGAARQRRRRQTHRPDHRRTEELSRLRRQIRVLEEKRSILKNAASFFAKETR